MIGRRLALALALCAAWPCQAQDVAGEAGRIDRQLDTIYPDLFRLYTEIHAHPELGGQETRTAALLAAQMRQLGFDVTEHVGGTGVVAVLRNGEGPTVLVRTEMDGLPMEEKTGLRYASRAQAEYNGQPSFLAHSCGHDVHMAAWVGTARALTGMKDRWKGTLVFIAQPAEETLEGAAAMLADGLYERFPEARLRVRAAHRALCGRAGALPAGPAHVELGHHRDHIQGPRRPRLGTAHRDRPGAGRRTLPGRRPGGRRPRKEPAAAWRDHLRLDPWRHRGQHHPRGGRTSRHCPQLRPGGARDLARRHRSRGARIRGDGRRARARGPAPARSGFGGQRTRADRAHRRGVPPGVRRSRNSQARLHHRQRGLLALRASQGSTRCSSRSASTIRRGSRRAKNGGEPLPFNHSPFYAPVPEPTIRTGVKAMSLAVLGVLGN